MKLRRTKTRVNFWATLYTRVTVIDDVETNLGVIVRPFRAAVRLILPVKSARRSEHTTAVPPDRHQRSHSGYLATTPWMQRSAPSSTSPVKKRRRRITVDVNLLKGRGVKWLHFAIQV